VETTAAILLRRTKLSETSWIVTWFTEAHGKIKTVAKGARQPKSRFAGVLDLFFDCEIQFARSRKSELHQLREVALREPRAGLREDYGRVALGAYFVELIELVTEAEHPAPELYDLLQRGLGFLNTQPASLRALLHFERELVRLLGIHGQTGVTPAVAIGRAYQRVPKGRPGLLKALRAGKPEEE
jgi:DNA repair protein RecO (recombination protein O)